MGLKRKTTISRRVHVLHDDNNIELNSNIKNKPFK